MSISYPLTLWYEVLEFSFMLKCIPTRFLIFLSLWLGLTACTPIDEESFIEVESKEYLAAKQKMREGDVVGALEMFERVIDKYPYTPESYLEVGVIYLRHEDEPVLAIYHFHKYLELKPDSREAPLVEELIMSSKKQFAASLPGNPFKDAVSRMELLETIAGLKRRLEALNEENLKLKEQSKILQQRLSGTQDTMREILTTDMEMPPGGEGNEGIRSQQLVVDAQTEAQVQEMLPHESEHSRMPDTYQVKSGDSLYAISMNFYGDSEHIHAIFQANRNILKSVNDLRPGQVLKLPK